MSPQSVNRPQVNSILTYIIFYIPASILKPIDASLSNSSGPILLTWFNFNPSMDK